MQMSTYFSRGHEVYAQHMCGFDIRLHLRQLNLSGCRNLTDASAQSIAQYCRQLMDVNMRCGSISRYIELQGYSVRIRFV